jgi:deazaflavin-dependent oxidoreductase (nitroreductase family)
MTPTTTEAAVALPPRPIVRIFWLLHRTAHRLTGGRFGLTRPRAGERFGMLRLATVGRRSGRARVAIVGYIEDGPNLVTIAMNGWGEAEPAWWLNLQARPEAVVGLRDGDRLVRARAASGQERDRLWAILRRTSGWGDDLDALAAHRSVPSAVVVLEPRSPGDGASAEDPAWTMVTAPTPSVAESAALPARAPVASSTGRRWRLRARHLWLVPGLAVAVLAGEQSKASGLGLLPVIVFSIVPHVPAWLGSIMPRQRGPLGSLFDLFHRPLPPTVVAIVAGVGLLPPIALVGGLAWLGHILIDQALGTGELAGHAGRRSGSRLARLLDRVRPTGATA